MEKNICLQCQAYERQLAFLDNFNLRLAIRNDRLEGLCLSTIGEPCGIEISDPVDLTWAIGT